MVSRLLNFFTEARNLMAHTKNSLRNVKENKTQFVWYILKIIECSGCTRPRNGPKFNMPKITTTMSMMNLASCLNLVKTM